MIKVDEACANKILGLFKEVDPIIPDEWKDVVNHLVKQLKEKSCDEFQISLVMNFLKRIIKEELEDEMIEKEMVESDHLKIETQVRILIVLLSELLVCQNQSISNKIGR